MYSDTRKETKEEFYKRWRWITYNQLDLYDLIDLDRILRKEYPYKISYPNEIIDAYSSKNFEVSNEKIKKYDDIIILNVDELNNKSSKMSIDSSPNYGQFLRSIFIENCFIDISKFEKDELIRLIKRNIIYYKWWDTFSFLELSENILTPHFLMSTKKLIGKEPLIKYFQSRFQTKYDFIDYLLSNFNPNKNSIKEMNNAWRQSTMYDYEWLFGNEIKRSIRIFENECRIQFGEKIIGSFFNEDILFREVKKNFEKKYKVISQGSPEWLTPQRFDIYFPEINFAIEYQGEQHQRPVDFGGKGEKEAKKQFLENKRRDLLKKQKSDQNGCYIHYVYPKYDMKDIISELKILIKLWQKNELK